MQLLCYHNRIGSKPGDLFPKTKNTLAKGCPQRSRESLQRASVAASLSAPLRHSLPPPSSLQFSPPPISVSALQSASMGEWRFATCEWA